MDYDPAYMSLVCDKMTENRTCGTRFQVLMTDEESGETWLDESATYEEYYAHVKSNHPT